MFNQNNSLIKSEKQRGWVARLVVLLVILALGAAIYLNLTTISDQVRAWMFHPSSAVASLDSQLDLTPTAQRIFYASTPSIEGASTLDKTCPQLEVGNPILGCYAGGAIHIYNITNQQLAGIQQVTAAHELLHAIWERLPQSERNSLGTLLMAEYKKLNDPELESRMDYYQREEPGEMTNELHSILGTEYPNLGSELESHYAKYFKNRAKIVSYNSQYKSVFNNLNSQVSSMQADLNQELTNINTAEVQYQKDLATLTSDINDFNRRANNGYFTSESQFQSERASLVKRSNQLDAEAANINAQVDDYNSKLTTYNQLLNKLKGLNDSLQRIPSVEGAPSV